MYGNTLAAGCRGGNCSIVKEGKSFAIWHKPYLNFILYEIWIFKQFLRHRRAVVVYELKMCVRYGIFIEKICLCEIGRKKQFRRSCVCVCDFKHSYKLNDDFIFLWIHCLSIVICSNKVNHSKLNSFEQAEQSFEWFNVEKTFIALICCVFFFYFFKF